jgi:hypothetical protein
MALHLSERQQTAAALARELQKLDGVWVTNPMPLDDNARGLRIQILDKCKNEVLQLLTNWGWSPVFCGMLPRVCSSGFQLASVHEIYIERERQPIFNDHTIRGEIATGKPKTDPTGILKYLGWKK